MVFNIWFRKLEINYLCTIVPTNTTKNIELADTLSKTLQTSDTVCADSITSSLFQGHLLPVKHEGMQLHLVKCDFWSASVLMCLYLLFIWLYVSNRKRLNQMISAFYFNRNSNVLSRDEFTIGNRVAVFLSVFFVVANTIFILHLLPVIGVSELPFNNLTLGFIIAGGLVFIYAVKMLLIKFIGYIFKVQKEASEYSMLVFLFCNVLGLFMLPLSVLLTFMRQVAPSVFVNVGIFMVASFIVIRIIRGLFLGLNSSRISKFYLFIYLCTLEIMPFVILTKLFMQKLV